MPEPSPNQEERDQQVHLLTGRIAAGSEVAFGSLYGMIFDPLFRSVLVRTRGDEELAKEVVQMVLLRLVRHSRPFSTERALWAWLRRVAHSCQIDLLRKSGREPATCPLDLFGESLAGTDVDDEDDVLMAALERSIPELDRDERDLLRLVYFEGLTHRDIAARLNSSPKAVESKLARTRGKLKQLLLQILHQYALF